MKNKRVKVEMARAGINQARLAELLNISTPELSIMLNKYELAVKEQNEIVSLQMSIFWSVLERITKS